MNKPVTILDRKLFAGDFKKITLHGFELEVGKLKNGKHGIASAILEINDAHYHDKLNFILDNHQRLAEALEMPVEAAELYLESYEAAIVEKKMKQSEAEEYAMAAVKKAFYQNPNGHWVKLSENWLEEVTKEIEPTVQVLAVGKYTESQGRDVDITTDKMDKMIANFEAGRFTPNVTVDHIQAGPSMGGAKKLFRIGEKMYATLSQLVPALVKKIKAGMYKYISSEFYENFITGNGEEIGPLFTTVSFLGSKKPAIKGMDTPQMSERGALFALSVIDNDFCKQLTQHKPLNDRKGGHLIEFKTQEELDQYVKTKVDPAVSTALSEVEDKHKAEKTQLSDKIKKLEDENKSLSEESTNRRKAEAKKLAEADVKEFTSKEKMKILPGNEVAIKAWNGRFEQAHLAENSDEAVEALKTELEAMPSLFKFEKELTNDNDNDNPKAGDGTVEFSEKNQEELQAICKFMDAHKWEYELSDTGLIVAKDNSQLSRATAAVRAGKR